MPPRACICLWIFAARSVADMASSAIIVIGFRVIASAYFDPMQGSFMLKLGLLVIRQGFPFHGRDNQNARLTCAERPLELGNRPPVPLLSKPHIRLESSDVPLKLPIGLLEFRLSRSKLALNP